MFLFDERYATFEMFSLSHLVPVVMTIAAVVLIAVFRRRLSAMPRFDRNFRIVLAVTTVTLELVFNFWAIVRGGGWSVFLPFGLCTLSMYLTAIALLSRSDRLAKVIYPWAVSGALLSLLVADVAYDFPHFRYFHYFGNHAMFLVANVYMQATAKTRFSYRDLLRSSGILLMIAVPMYFLNRAWGTNHMFLAELPHEVDFLFYWIGSPGWVFLFGFAIFILFHLVSLPFLIRGKGRVPA
ncbi:MAG: TIGR02206 family membrane protein [Candidatus Izemoplasmatales bacterium]